jgi:hypothetical protein
MNGAGIVAAADGEFIVGLVIGVFLGLLLGPVLRSWLAWREWVEASREADLTDRLLVRLEEGMSPSDDRSSATQGAAEHRTAPPQPSGPPPESEPDGATPPSLMEGPAANPSEPLARPDSGTRWPASP